jgi:hypothetical protein
MTNRRRGFTAIDCCDLRLQSIDKRMIAAICADLHIDVGAAEDFANDIVVKELGSRPSA